MSLNKKGDINEITKIILVLFSLIIMYIIITGGYKYFIEDTGTTEACKNWVNLQSTPVLKEAADFKSPCITRQDTIKDADDKEEIYEQLAKSMYSCWDVYGQGEADFYSEIDFGVGETYCRICEEISVSSELDQDKRELDLDDFEVYLSNNYPPASPNTYSEFFVAADNSKLDFGSGTLVLDPTTKVYTMFMVNKGADWSATGILDKFVIIPGSVLIGASQVPGSSNLFKGLGGLIKFKQTVPSLPNIPGSGGTITKTAPLLGKTGWGLLIMYVATSGLATAADGSVLYPSLTLISSTSNELLECDGGIYYKPRNN